MEKIDQALRILYQRYSMGDLKRVEDIMTYAIPCHRGANEEQHARLVHVPGAATREDVIAIANMFEGTVEERAARMAKIVLGNPDTNQDISDLIDMSFDPGLKCDKEGRICHGNTDFETPNGTAQLLYSSMHENLGHCHPMVQAVHMRARLPKEVRPAALYNAMQCAKAYSNCPVCQKNDPVGSANNKIWILNTYCQSHLAQLSEPAYEEFMLRHKEYRQVRGLPDREEVELPDSGGGDANPEPAATESKQYKIISFIFAKYYFIV